MTTEILNQLKTLWRAAFGDTDAFIDRFFATGFSEDRCNYRLENGQVCSALYWFDCQWEGQTLAYIYALATDPAHRGKGFGATLLQQTHKLLHRRGYGGCVLCPADGLIPYYQRLGYEVCSYVNQFDAAAYGEPAALRPISAAEYAALRKGYLPAGAVLQEGVLLDFLGTWTQFYQGKDFLLCAAREKSTLYVQEFLGDPAAVPGILQALGIPKSQFRTPGTQIPSAMFLSLQEATKLPTYLGLPLD